MNLQDPGISLGCFNNPHWTGFKNDLPDSKVLGLKISLNISNPKLYCEFLIGVV